MGQWKKCRLSGKRKFATHESALFRGGIILEKSRNVKALRAYRCTHCGFWHLTKAQ